MAWQRVIFTMPWELKHTGIQWKAPTFSNQGIQVCNTKFGLSHCLSRHGWPKHLQNRWRSFRLVGRARWHDSQGIQNKDLCKIHSDAGDKKTSGVDKKSWMRCTEPCITSCSTIRYYVFERSLAPASQVVKGSDPTNLKYKLTNIQLEHEMICSKTLANEAHSIYCRVKSSPMTIWLVPKWCPWKKTVAWGSTSLSMPKEGH